MTNTYGERCNSTALFSYNSTVIDNYRDIYYLVTNDTSGDTNKSITNLTDPTTLAATLNLKLVSGALLKTFVIDQVKQYGVLLGEIDPIGTIVPTLTNPNLITITIQGLAQGSFPGGSLYVGIYVTLDTALATANPSA